MNYKTLVLRNGQLCRALAIVDSNSLLNQNGGIKSRKELYRTDKNVAILNTVVTSLSMGITNVTTGEYSGYAIRRVKQQ